MDDLRTRFKRIDRVEAPDLWPEAVERAAAADGSGMGHPIRTMTSVLVAALLLALLAGVVAVGMSQRPRVQAEERPLVNVDCQLVLAPSDDGPHQPVAGGPDACIRGAAELRVDAGGGRIAVTTTCGKCFGFEGAATQWAGVIDVSTRHSRELDSCGVGEGRCFGDIAISSDGRRVAYARWDDVSGTTSLVLADLETNERRTVALALLPYTPPAWTPDGEAVIVSASPATGTSPTMLYRVPFGGEPAPIFDGSGKLLSTIDVSPDGRSIAFVAHGASGDPPELRVTVIGESASATLSRGAAGSTFIGVSWSPDGTSIAVTEVPIAMMTGSLAVHVVAVEEGTASTPYRTDGDCCRHSTAATWSSDGRSLRLALRADPDVNGTYTVPADGSGPARLLTEELVLGWVGR